MVWRSTQTGTANNRRNNGFGRNVAQWRRLVIRIAGFLFKEMVLILAGHIQPRGAPLSCRSSSSNEANGTAATRLSVRLPRYSTPACSRTPVTRSYPCRREPQDPPVGHAGVQVAGPVHGDVLRPGAAHRGHCRCRHRWPAVALPGSPWRRRRAPHHRLDPRSPHTRRRYRRVPSAVMVTGSRSAGSAGRRRPPPIVGPVRGYYHELDRFAGTVRVSRLR
jgi:hypothetical protein